MIERAARCTSGWLIPAGPLHRRRRCVSEAFATVCLLAVMQFLLSVTSRAIDFDHDCARVIDTEVTVSDEVRAGEATSTARARALMMASQAALTQTIGNRVSAESNYGLQAHNKDIDERLLHRIRSQASGFVKQQVTDERVDTQSGREMLFLHAKASVCVPRTPTLVKETARITSARNIKGDETAEFRDALLDAFSASPSLVVTDDPENAVDLEIDARINRIEWAGTGKSFPPDVPAGGLARPPNAPTEVQRLTVGVTIHARRTDDNAIATVALNRWKNFPPTADAASVAPAYVRDMLKQAALELQDKITALRIQDLSANKASAKPGSEEW
jgi:hypothetical protein